MATLFDRFHAFLGFYVPFINKLGAEGLSLLSLAVATVSSLVYSLSRSEIPTFVDNLHLIQSFAVLYLVSIALYIRYCRSNEPQAPMIRHPILRTFFISMCYVASLTLFAVCKEPLSSVRNLYVPVICVSAYLHILIVLTILRHTEHYGIAFCCLLVANTVVVPMAETNLQLFFVYLVSFKLCCISNLPFQSDPIISSSGVQETKDMGEAHVDTKKQKKNMKSHPQFSFF